MCSIRALTLEGTGSVDADGASPTNAWSVTFIDIVTTNGRIASETWWTGATKTSWCVGTDGAFSAAALLSEDSLCQIAFVDILAAGRHVGRVISPTVVAYAEGFFTLRFASCVLAAFNTVARSSAGGEWRFADKSGLAFAPVATGQISTQRIGSARLLEALVNINASGSFGNESLEAEALSVDTLGVADTVKIAFAVGRYVHLFTRHVRRRLGSVATRAEAVVTRYGVLADGVLATRTGRQDGAFVNVNASVVGIACIILETRTDEAAGCIGACSVGAARIAQALIDIFTSDGWIALESGRTLATEGSGQIVANGAPTANGLSAGQFC